MVPSQRPPCMSDTCPHHRTACTVRVSPSLCTGLCRMALTVVCVWQLKHVSVTLVGNLDPRKLYLEAGRRYKPSVPFAQFFCEPKTSL